MDSQRVAQGADGERIDYILFVGDRSVLAIYRKFLHRGEWRETIAVRGYISPDGTLEPLIPEFKNPDERREYCKRVRLTDAEEIPYRNISAAIEAAGIKGRVYFVSGDAKEENRLVGDRQSLDLFDGCISAFKRILPAIDKLRDAVKDESDKK